MVAVVSGSSLGLFNGGNADGNPQVGRGRDRAYVNTTTGNLVIQSVDDTLAAIGFDFAGVRTYNSQGFTDEDNNDQWRLGVHQKIVLTSGTVNQAGSVVTKTFGDGAEVRYTWNTTRSRYESTDGDGANDFLTWDGTNSRWTWTDGSSRATEEYWLVNGVQRIRFSRDADGNTVTYNYTVAANTAGSLLTSINMAGSLAQTVEFEYSGDNLTAVRVVSWNTAGTQSQTQTLTRYRYDSLNRLQQVIVDLTPLDNTVALPDANGDGLIEPLANETYITTYTYDSNSKRVASITHSDGSTISFTYLNVDNGYRLQTVTDGELRVTTFTYADIVGSGGTPATANANPVQITNQDTSSGPHDIRGNQLVTGDTTPANVPYALNTQPLTVPSGSGGAWGTTSILDNTTDAISSPRVAYANNGDGIAAWRQGGAVFVRRYTASSNTWGPITQFDSGASGANTVKLAMDPVTGAAMLAWSKTSGSLQTVSTAYMSAAGTWTQALAFDSATAAAMWEDNLSVAVYGTHGAVSYVYNDSSVEGRVELAVFNSGVLVRTPDLLDAVGFDARFPTVAIDPNGNAIVTWQEMTSAGGERVYYNRWNATTQSFDGPQIFDTHPDGSRIAMVAYDAQGNATVIWRQWGGLQARRMLAGTSTWGAAVALQSVTTSSPSAYDLAVDSAGNVIAGWIQNDGSVNSAYARIFSIATGTWGPAMLVENDSAAVSGGDYISVDINGSRAVASWLQSNGVRYDVYGARFENGAWSPRELMDTRVESTGYAGAAIDAAGNAIVTWQQADNSSRSMYERRFAAGSGGPPYYSVLAGATWQSIASTLYGVNSVAAGAALQNAMPAGTSIAQGSQLLRTQLPDRLQVLTGPPAPDYYLVPGTPSTPTWRSIAAAVYGVDSVAAGDVLRDFMQASYPTLSVGLKIFNFPPSIVATGTITLPYYYHVVQSTSWTTTLQTIYDGVADPGLLQAVQVYSGVSSSTLTIGSRLRVQPQQEYTVGGSGTGPAIYRRTTVHTAVPNSTGFATTYLQDTQGRLVSVQTPAIGGAPIETRYTYDPVTGNVETVTQDPNGLNRVTTFTYDPNSGLLLNTRDSLGNTVSRTYNTSNQIETETSYLVRDPDGAGSGVPSVPLTSRFLYDANHHLRFSITPDGRVTEHIYVAGQRTTSFKYAANTYSGPHTTNDLNNWATTGQRATALERVEYQYDFRGNVNQITTFAATNTSGAGTGAASVTQLVYDQRGILLQTIGALGTPNSRDENNASLPHSTTYTYDGLGRLLTKNSWVSGTETSRRLETVLHQDASRSTVISLAGGLQRTLIYDRSGELVSVAYAGAAALGTTLFTYDTARRLRVTTDPTGVKTYAFYDDAGRRIGSVDGDGSVTQYFFNRANQVIKTIRYSTRLSATRLTNLAGGSWATDSFTDLRNEANVVSGTSQITHNVYDASGALVYTIDELGAVTQNVYDGAGQLTSEIRYFNPVVIPTSTDEVLPGSFTVAEHPNDRRTRYFYNGDGQLTGTLDGEGFLKENVYDAAGRLITQIGYFNASDSNRWLTGTLATLRPGSAGSVAQLDIERDVRARCFYDTQGRKVGELDGERYLTELRYDAAGRVQQSIRYDVRLSDASGTATFATLLAGTTGAPAHATVYTYDGLGQLLTETNFENTQTLYSYDVAGNLIAVTRANGVSVDQRTTRSRYDELGRVISELTGEGSVALAALGSTPTPEAVALVWAQHSVSYAYDIAGRRRSMTVSPEGAQTNTTFYYYDNDGRLRFELDALGRVTENRYDALGQLTDRVVHWRAVTVSSPQGGSLTPALIATLTGAESGNVHEHTQFGYSRRGELTSTSTLGLATTGKTYNVFGEVETTTLGAQTPLSYTYDRRGLQKLTLRASLTLENRTFDAFGRLTTFVDRGNTTTKTYDRIGREITSGETGDANARVITYDGFSRVTRVRDKLTNETVYQYFDLTKTMIMTTPEGVVVTTVHNSHGQTKTVAANGNLTEYQYDRDGRLLNVSDGMGPLEGRRYDRAGRQVEAHDARGIITRFEYDAANRLFRRTVDNASGGLALITTHQFDPLTRVLTTTEPGNRVTRTEYDRDGRVSSVIVDYGGQNPARTDYLYDAANNTVRVTEGVGGVAGTPVRRTRYVYDTAGRRTDEYVDPTDLGGTLNLHTEYRYDDNDNLTRKIDANNNSTWYTYDAQHRLVQTIDALGGVTQQSYDAEDRVITKRRLFNTVATGSLGNTPAIQNVPHTPNDQVSRTVYDRDGRAKYTLSTSAATGSSGNVTSESAIVTERTFDSGGNVTRTRIYRNAIAVPGSLGTANIEAALGNASNVITTLHADDRVEWTAYDLRGRVMFAVDGSGAVVKREYDSSGNITATIAYADRIALGEQMPLTTLEPWANNTSVATNTKNRVSRFWYDTLDRQRFALDAEGYLVETRYLDGARQQSTVVYAGKPSVPASATLTQVGDAASAAPSQALNQTTTQTFDAAGRVIQVADADGRSEYFGYDGVGNKTRHVNKKASSSTDVAYTWTFEYDANHRLIYERSPQVSVTTINATTLAATESTQQLVTRNEYDALGNVTHRTEAYGTAQARVTSFEYDLLARQTAVVSPTVGVYDSAAGDTEFGANSATVQRREVDRRIRSETLYDSLGNAVRNRLVTDIEASTAGAGVFTYKAYDNLGRVKYDVDAKSQVTSYLYDAYGNKLEVTRHALALSTALAHTDTITQSLVLGRLQASSANRTITSIYDRLSRATAVIQPSVRAFSSTPIAADGTYFDAQPRVDYTYNAFGDLVKTSELVSTGITADSYFYYDNRGLKTAEVNSERYLTRYFHEDETGDLTRVVEYAARQAGPFTTTGYGPVTTSAGAESGSDRQTDYGYDKLNRKVSETKANLEYWTEAGAPATQHVGMQTTTFGYDVLGNQTRTSVANSANSTVLHTYTYYDVLGRAIAVAQPPRETRPGVSATPYSRMLRDAHGNLVQQIEYYDGATGATEGALPTTPSSNSTLNRVTTMRVDAQGRVLTTKDATDAVRHASYNLRGDVAKEWQVVTNAGLTETLVSIYRYDSLGQTTEVEEGRRYEGATALTVRRIAKYNAFGEIVEKYNHGDTLKTFFDYDQAGRIWRTNADDGVTKVFMYNLAGNGTLELRSRGTNLALDRTDSAVGFYTSAQFVLSNVVSTDLMRTETVYDRMGNVIERRLPTFLVSTGMAPVGTNLQLVSRSGEAWITWDGTMTETVIENLEVRVLGSNSAYTSVGVAQVSTGVMGANVHAFYNQPMEYRIRYTRGADVVPFAESSGTFRVDRLPQTTFHTISQTLFDVANDVSTVRFESSGPRLLTASFGTSASWNGTAQAWTGTNLVNVNLDGLGGPVSVFINFVSKDRNGNPIYSPLESEQINLASTAGLTSITWNDNPTSGPMPMNGGIMDQPFTINVYGNDENGNYALLASTAPPQNSTTPMVVWNIPPGGELSVPESQRIEAVFRYKRASDTGWASVEPQRFGTVFRVPVQTLLTSNSTYNFEIEYYRLGVLIAKRSGDLTSSGTSQVPTITSSSLGASSTLTDIFTGTVSGQRAEGTQMVWDPPSGIPPGKVVRATLEVFQGSNTVLNTQLAEGVWRIDLASLARNVPYTYRMTYSIDGRAVAQQTGPIQVQFAVAQTTTALSNLTLQSNPPPVPDVATLSGENNVSNIVGTRGTSAAWQFQIQRWNGMSQVILSSYAPIPGNVPVRVVARYHQVTQGGLPDSSQGGSIPWQGNSGSIPSILELSESHTNSLGGIAVPSGSSNPISVTIYGLDANNLYTVVLRQTGASGNAATPRLSWAAPSDGSLIAAFSYSNATSSGPLTVTTNSTTGIASVDLGSLNGTFDFVLTYRRPDDSSPVITRSGGQFRANRIESTIVSQGAVSNANTASLGVDVSGNMLTWERAAAGNNVTFKYRVQGAAEWQTDRQAGSSNNANYSASLYNLPTETYEYLIEYRTGSNPMAARAIGTVRVTTSTSPAVDGVVIDQVGVVTQPLHTSRITDAAMTSGSDLVTWTRAKVNASDIIELEYWIGTTRHSAQITGSGPGYSARMSAVTFGLNQSIAWKLTYRHTVGGDPYAQANGTATFNVEGAPQVPTITLGPQVARFPSGVINAPAPVNLGGNQFGWNGLSIPAGATVALYINDQLVTHTQSGGTVSIDGANWAVSNSNRYDLRITRAGESEPYARSIGFFALSRAMGPMEPTSTFAVNTQRPERALEATPVYNPGVITLPRYTGDSTEAVLTYWLLATPAVRTTLLGAPAYLPNGFDPSWDFDLAALTMDGSYGYRIEIRRSGSAFPFQWQDGTFSRANGGAARSITPLPANEQPDTSVTPTLKQAFDRWGNVIAHTDAAGNVTKYRFNTFSQLVQTNEAMDIVYQYTAATQPGTVDDAEKRNYYDLLGRLIETQDGNSNATRVTYNAVGQEISRLAPDNGLVRKAYDIFGNVLQITDEFNYRTRNKYDKLGRITQIWREIELGVFNLDDPASTATSTLWDFQAQYFVYDEAGRRISDTSGIDSEITRYRYDLLGNISRRTTNLQAVNNTLGTRYEYDANGKLTRETDAIGSYKTWSYDEFGRLKTHLQLQPGIAAAGDPKGLLITYDYDYFAGQLDREISFNSTTNSTEGTDIRYTYDRAGNVSKIDDQSMTNGTRVNRQTKYRYDSAGRRARETVQIAGREHQDTRISYDAHNRVRNLDDADYREQVFYDANGNRSLVTFSYVDHANAISSGKIGYTYDSMNRVKTTAEISSLREGSIDTTFWYDRRGNRTMVQSEDIGLWERRQTGSVVDYRITNPLTHMETENYEYDGLSRLKRVWRDIDYVTITSGVETNRSTQPVVTHEYKYDNANRRTDDLAKSIQKPTGENGELITRHTRTQYDSDGRVASNTVRRNSEAGYAESITTYGRATANASHVWTAGFDDAGNLRGYDVSTHNVDNGNVRFNTQYRNKFELRDGYKEVRQDATSTGGNPPGPAYSIREYNVNGELLKFTDSVDTSRSRHFANNQSGQALTVMTGAIGWVEQAWDAAIMRGNHGGSFNYGMAQYYFFQNDKFVGSFGQVQKYGAYEADFDASHEPIGDTYPSSVPATVITQEGDTLRGVAERVFGDASLWYVIADENGLTNPDAVLRSGTQLRVPNDVVSLTNSGSNFRPFDAAEAIGDMAPTLPAPPVPGPGRCATFGLFIVIVVMIVVTVLTSGAAAGAMGGASAAGGTGAAAATGTGAAAATGAAAGGLSATTISVASSAIGAAVGSVVSQGVGIALGVQDRFSWSQVGLAAISAGVGAGLGQSGVLFSTNSQIFNAAANAAIVNAVTQGVSIAVGLQEKFDWRSVAQSAVAAPLAMKAGQFAASRFGGQQALGQAGYNAAKFARDAAGTITSAAVRSAMGGKFDEKQVAADVFGNLIANSLVKVSSATGTVYERDAMGGGPGGDPLTDSVAYQNMSPAERESALAKRALDWDRMESFVTRGEHSGSETAVGDHGEPLEEIVVQGNRWDREGQEVLFQRYIAGDRNRFGHVTRQEENTAAFRATVSYNRNIHWENYAQGQRDQAIFNDMMMPWNQAINAFYATTNALITAGSGFAGMVGTNPIFGGSVERGSRWIGSWDALHMDWDSPLRDAMAVGMQRDQENFRAYGEEHWGDRLTTTAEVLLGTIGESANLVGVYGARGFGMGLSAEMRAMRYRPYGSGYNPANGEILTFVPERAGMQVVYRGITAADAAAMERGAGLTAKAPDGTWTVEQHILNDGPGVGGAAKNSPWISSSPNLGVASAYDSGLGVIAIDLNKVPSLKVELWRTAPNVKNIDGLLYNRAVWSQEVSIFRDIPAEAIIGKVPTVPKGQ